MILALPVATAEFTLMVSEATVLSTLAGLLASFTVMVTLQGPSAAGAVKTTVELPSVVSLPAVSTWVPRLPAQVVVQTACKCAVWPASGSCAVALMVTVSFGETRSALAVSESITGASLESATPGATWFMSMMTVAVAFLVMITQFATPA